MCAYWPTPRLTLPQVQVKNIVLLLSFESLSTSIVPYLITDTPFILFKNIVDHGVNSVFSLIHSCFLVFFGAVIAAIYCIC